MPRKPHCSRNPKLSRGITAYGRSAMYRRSGRLAKKQSGVPWKTVTRKEVEVKEPIEKTYNGTETRVVYPKAPRFYPAYDVKHPLKSKKRRANHKPTRLRASITPGTVLILLAGRFRGKRVIFLKQLPSGLLLITGPFKINGVPARRVNQAYVIATSTKVDISGLEIPKDFNDEYFSRPKVHKKKETEEDFFAEETEKKELDPNVKELQSEFDKRVVAIVSEVPKLDKYLNAKFSLSRNDRPHLMKF
eukprot:CAMPEP_0174250044 /NCGR_PEP_ID=MMETSP0439-20130205/342_1 /TAXON_ID=0 /ORGANISM="Stereomyxa ramosa, Strain Chinc5" /LENGTH=246 /DNA_ID=CAMNT_0015330015 /DNA_START=31 /DNA_END=771 /DNA_ORIENTATION=-